MAPILIIDDDIVVRMLLQTALKNQGYEVLVAEDGQSGIAQAQKHHPGVVICDWMMPELDGLAVCRHLKADPALATSFFILLTSKGDVTDRVQGLDSGADEFLAKPIEATELRARVRAGLRLYELNQAFQQRTQQLEHELSEAAQYVQSLLPKPLTSPVEIKQQFLSCLQLGGDCFDYRWLDDNSLVFYLLDISGHGVGPALLSVSVLNLLRSEGLSGVDPRDPAAVLTRLNQRFQMSEQGDRYFTIWYGVYDRAHQTLTYASAGHPPALQISTSASGEVKLTEMPALSLPIGFLPDTQYKVRQHKISPGDVLYVFSDGIYEVFDNQGDHWGIQAFKDHLLSASQTQPVVDLPTLIKDIRGFSGDGQFQDDVSLLQVRFPGTEEPA